MSVTMGETTTRGTKPDATYRSNTICIDFDGVIAEFTRDINEFGTVLAGTAEATAKLKALGYKIIIHTARPNTPEHIAALARHLRDNHVCFDEINSDPNAPWASGKPLADFYVDDRAVAFNRNWDDILWQVSRRDLHSVLETYEALLGLVRVRAASVAAFDHLLRERTNWLTSPASTRFHLAEDGGLLRHSMNVAETLLKMRRTLCPDISMESCVITGLFHDVGKVGYPGQAYYLPNPDKWQVRNRGIRYVINPECPHMDLATRSLFLITPRVELTTEEAQAIRYHDGQYIEENHSVAHREMPLTRLIQYADNWSGGVLEEE
ncbi:MAG: hypothetical protein V1809_05785 [Planctomycetota bacterium]